MSWQDLVLASGGALFAVALIPSVIGRSKPALSTSILNSAVLLSYVVVYTQLKLWYATFTTTLVCGLWVILGVQKFQQRKNN